MGTFDSGPDPRRLARRTAGDLPPDLASIVNRATVLPGSVHSDQTPPRGLIASKINFDRASFAYDDTAYASYFVKGAADSSANLWTKIGGGGGGNDVRAYIGPTDVPLYAWVWASYIWRNQNTGGSDDFGRTCAALYETGLGGQVAYARSLNTASDWLPQDAHYRQFSYLGFFQIPVVDGADWYIGLQQQFSSSGQGSQSIKRQHIIAFVSAVPDDGTDNTTTDDSLA